MKITFFLPLALAMLFSSCAKDEALNLAPAKQTEPTSKSVDFRTAGDFEVFFAQTHVLRPQDAYFGLVSDRPALVKAHLFSETGERAPDEVVLKLSLNGKSREFDLQGPAILPLPQDLSPGKVIHSADDSYTYTIPKEWIQPGLEVTITAGDQQVTFTDLRIGAPNRIPITMFDYHFFSKGSGDYPSGWELELDAKLPTAGFDLRRVSGVVFPEVSIAARHEFAKAARVSSPEEYRELTGKKFDNEQATAMMWNRALHAAGGRITERGIFAGNLYNVRSEGQGSDFHTVSNIDKPGVFFHELCHTMDLWHWSEEMWDAIYPYHGVMHGINPPENARGRHAGPTWKYDPATKEFISPVVGEGTSSRYKFDPMAGGGQSDRALGHLFSHLSDYSVDRARKFLENRISVWNEETGIYARWSNATGSYSRNIKYNDGVAFPQEPDTEVISIMASASYATPQANIAYPPIGPYVGGFIKLFDAENAVDRDLAKRTICKNNKCDVSVRVKQTGKETKTYILPIRLDPNVGAKKWNSLVTGAINLRASDGDVTKIELLSTPAVEQNGLPTTTEILYTWVK